MILSESVGERFHPNSFGVVIVSYSADPDEIATMGDDIVSSVESYTLDIKTREMTSIKTVYTFKDGTVEEGIVTITRDVEIPEKMKPFLAYEETTDTRTITIVSNPGTENEKTDTIQVAKGLQVSFTPDLFIETNFTMYSDEACTQPVEELDVYSDLTVYIKWDE